MPPGPQEQASSVTIVDSPNNHKNKNRKDTEHSLGMAFVSEIMDDGRVKYSEYKGDIFLAPADAVYVAKFHEMSEYLDGLYPPPRQGTHRFECNMSWYSDMQRMSREYCTLSGKRVDCTDLPGESPEEIIEAAVELCAQGWELYGIRLGNKHLWPAGLVARRDEDDCTVVVQDTKLAKSKLKRAATIRKNRSKNGLSVSLSDMVCMQNCLRDLAILDHPKIRCVGFHNRYAGFSLYSTADTMCSQIPALADLCDWMYRGPSWKKTKSVKHAFQRMRKGIGFLPKRDVFHRFWYRTTPRVEDHPAVQFVTWFIKQYAIIFPGRKAEVQGMKQDFRTCKLWLKEKIEQTLASRSRKEAATIQPGGKS